MRLISKGLSLDCNGRFLCFTLPLLRFISFGLEQFGPQFLTGAFRT